MTTLRLRILLSTLVLMLLIVIPLSLVKAYTPPALEVTPLPAVAQSDPFFGIVQAIHDPSKAVPAGVRWERLVLWWSNFQPDGPDDWNSDGWFARNLIEEQIGRGIEPVGVILHTPGWAASNSYDAISPPRNLDLPFDDPENYWGQFLSRLAKEYAGTVDTWILWNEPDIYKESYANWAGTIEEFARMQVVGYQAIKKANPNAKVILTGTTYWWDIENERDIYLDRLIAELMDAPAARANGGYFDAIAVHQYSNPLNSYAVPILYRRIAQKYDLDKPIWMIESNVVPHDDPLHPLHRGGLRASMEEQANYIIQSIALARAAGVVRYSVYKMRDETHENDQYYGLVRNDGSVRPAYVAYQVAAREMSNIQQADYFWSHSASPVTNDEITALLASTTEYPQFVWPGALNGVRMRRGSDRVTVLWNATAAELEVAIPSSVSTAKVINKYGQETTITRKSDGAFRLLLPAATNNTEARNPRLILVGGSPLIVVETGAANSRDAYPRVIDNCWDVPGAQIPPNPTISEAWVAPTGYAVSGPWLDYLRSHGDIDLLGYPRSPVVQDPNDSKQCVQYFQRVVLEWHPENPPKARILRRLLTEEFISPNPDPAQKPLRENDRDYWYFPKGPNGLGHAVSNYAPDNTPIGFKAYFDRYGREESFGYPMEPPTKRLDPEGKARWTQRFQAAIFEYHPEFDKAGNKPGTNIPWRTYSVQLQLLGDQYLRETKLPFIAGDPTEQVPTLPKPTP